MAATNSTLWHFCGAVLAGIQGLILKVVELQLLGLKLKTVIKVIKFYNQECSINSFSRNRKRRA